MKRETVREMAEIDFDNTQSQTSAGRRLFAASTTATTERKVTRKVAKPYALERA